MHLRAVDGDAFDEHVRHISLIERHFDFEALARELDAAGLASGGARDVEEKPDVRVRLVTIHPESNGLTGGVGRLVRDEFQRPEIPSSGIIAAGAVDVENGRALRGLAVLE